MVKLSYEIKGKGYPILCLHGHPGSSSSLSVFSHGLSPNYQTICPDLRGYGRSQTHQPFSMSDHLDDLSELLDHLNFEKGYLLGWSLGGILALELALKYPEKFTKIILIATSAYPQGDHPKITQKDLIFTAIAGIINYFFPGWRWNIETFGKKSLFQYLIQQHHPTAYYYLAKEGVSAYLKTSKWAEQALTKALKQGYNKLNELSKIEANCLILVGEFDRHITPESSYQTYQALKQAQWKCYPNTAHLFPWEISQQVVQDILQWLIME